MDNLPALPEGWHYEPHSVDPDVVHVVWADHGAVSVDFKHRNLATGWCVPGRAPHGATVFGGKGWKNAMVGEAVNRLRAAWN